VWTYICVYEQTFATFSPFISGGPLNLYNDQNMCLHFGMTIDGVTDQCIHPEGFASFLGLLESIPFHDVGSNYGSTEHAMPDLRCASFFLYFLITFSLGTHQY
jgi:hypothetical protein